MGAFRLVQYEFHQADRISVTVATIPTSFSPSIATRP